jgi:uronate dehydrogenase
MRKILITGAAGYLGDVLRRSLRGQYDLLLTDIAPLPDTPQVGETFAVADLGDATALAALMRDVDTVVHLGGCSVEAEWERILEANIAGTYNVFETARAANVKRVVYASSHHAVGYYRRTQPIGAEEPPRPDSRYGVSKVFGEALGRMYADKYGM